LKGSRSIHHQAAGRNLAKEEAERVFCTTLIESEQKSNRKTLTKQELTGVKLLSAALEHLSEYYQ
jgi:hypothetical protein